MKLITRQSLANDVAKKWKIQYPSSVNAWFDSDEIYKNLIDLGSVPSPDDVDEVIGNGSWTRTRCHECGAENIDVVELGEEPDYESSTAHICKECLIKAVELFGEAK